MKERPILFNGPMVRAILNGRKTQTRRVVKPQSSVDVLSNGAVTIEGWVPELRCPFGKVGDRLWVRETWCVGSPFDDFAPSKLNRPRSNSRLATDYAANDTRVWGEHDQGKWRPSIHMPRWASRLTLEITAVRVERLQDISEEDAKAEGVVPFAASRHTPANFRDGFTVLWQFIHGPGSWDANPWVWVIEFRKAEEVK